MKTNHSDIGRFNDNELFLLSLNNEVAFDELYSRYVSLGNRIAYNVFFEHGYGEAVVNEYLPEIDFVFLSCYRSFNPAKSKFRTYFTAILYNSIRKYIGRVLLSNDALRRSVSLDEFLPDFGAYEIFEDKGELSPIDYTSFRELRLSMSSPSRGKNSGNIKLAKKIGLLKLAGYSFSEIGNILGMSKQKAIRIYNNYFKDKTL